MGRIPPHLSASDGEDRQGLERLVSQVAAERRLDQHLLRDALLGDPEFRLLCEQERALRGVPGKSPGLSGSRGAGGAHGLLRIAFLMAEAADRVARSLEDRQASWRR